MKEMQTDPRVLEKLTGGGKPELTDSRWEYQGYGIWENSETRTVTNGIGNVTASNFQNQTHTVSNNTSLTNVQSSASGSVSVEQDGPGVPNVRPLTGATAASSATQELDDLMSSLNSFKMKGETNTTELGVSGSRKDDNTLDNMLGNLQQDMDKQGVKISAKGLCSACEKPIVGQVVTALGRTWHPEVMQLSHILYMFAGMTKWAWSGSTVGVGGS